MADVPWRALVALAAAEARRSWRALVAVGVLAGLAGAAVVGAAAGARRTATAFDRLRRETRIDDARVFALGAVPEPAVRALPDVVGLRRSAVGVGQLAGSQVSYVAVQAVDPAPGGPFQPIVVQGRAARPGAADEAVMIERVARTRAIEPGAVFSLKMLTPAEVQQFGTGFGEPDGPAVRLRITGLVRVPGPSVETAPILAGPAFAARHPDVMTGSINYLRLRRGPASIPAVRGQFDRLAATIPSSGPVPPLDLVRPDDADATIRATARVLTRGLLVFAAVAGAVGALSAALAFLRYHAGTAADQRTESALGLTAGERVLARVVAGGVSAAAAAVVAVGGSLALAAMDPIGPVSRLEPHPGWAPNVGLVAAGAVAAAAATVALVAFSARRSGRPEQGPAAAGAAWRLPGAPWFTTGVRFALERGSARRRLPVRSSLAGVALGVLGVLGCSIFAASRDGLVADRPRWGWSADLAVIDVTDATLAELAADARLADVTVARVAPVRVGGDDVTAYALSPVKGGLGWTLEAGHQPTGPAEVVLGRRLSERLGRTVGAVVAVGGRRLAVVGVGYGPSLSRDRFGDNLLLAPAGLDAVRRSQPDREALVRARPGADLAGLAAELGAAHEIATPEAPPEVADLAALGRLPTALGGCLALIAGAALSHLLLVTTRRRAPELAVLRVLGFTPTQAASSILVTALATAAVGAGAGIVLGVAAGRLVWNAVVGALGIPTPPSVPGAAVAAVVTVLPVAAVLIAALPARRAGALRPAVLLREE